MWKLLLIAPFVIPFAASAAEYPVMLDRPGAWESIQKEDPETYKQLVAILAAAERYGCSEELPTALQARFGVRAARCTGFPMMTEPQKARLTFKLGDTQYSTTWVPSRGTRTGN